MSRKVTYPAPAPLPSSSAAAAVAARPPGRKGRLVELPKVNSSRVPIWRWSDVELSVVAVRASAAWHGTEGTQVVV